MILCIEEFLYVETAWSNILALQQWGLQISGQVVDGPCTDYLLWLKVLTIQ